MSKPFFEIEQVNTFNVKMDLATLGALEKGMAFYSERAILQDGDPAKDLSRKLTSLLMKMAVTRNREEAPDVASLPPSREEVAEIAAPKETQETPTEPQERVVLTEEEAAKLGPPPEGFKTEPLDEPALPEVKGSQTITVEDDVDPLGEQLDAMIGED